MAKSATDLEGEVKLLTKDDETSMREFFEKTLNVCKEVLSSHETKVQKYQEDIAFFGETNTNDIPGFFNQWEKFLLSFRAAVKFNLALKKKRQGEEEKHRKEQEKQQEEQSVKKFAETLRATRAGQVPGETESTEKKPLTKREQRKRVVKEKKKVNNIVDDIISDNADFMEQGPSTDVRGDNGVIEQVSKGLKASDTFTRLRGKRLAAAAATKPPVAESVQDDDDDDLAAAASSTKKVNIRESTGGTKVSSAAKRQLVTQKSTFTRVEARRAKKKANLDNDKPPSAPIGTPDAGAAKRISIQNVIWN